MFAFLDMRNFLAAPTWDAELELFRRMLAAGVFMTPGRDFHTAEPGFFRCCFAWVEPEILELAFGRLKSCGVFCGPQRSSSASTS